MGLLKFFVAAEAGAQSERIASAPPKRLQRIVLDIGVSPNSCAAGGGRRRFSQGENCSREFQGEFVTRASWFRSRTRGLLGGMHGETPRNR